MSILPRDMADHASTPSIQSLHGVAGITFMLRTAAGDVPMRATFVSAALLPAPALRHDPHGEGGTR